MDGWLAGLISGIVGATVAILVVAPLMFGPLGPVALFPRCDIKDPQDRPIIAVATGVSLLAGLLVGLLFGLIVVDILLWSQVLWSWGLLMGLIVVLLQLLVWGPLVGFNARLAALPRDVRLRAGLVFLVANLLFGLVVGILVAVWAV